MVVSFLLCVGSPVAVGPFGLTKNNTSQTASRSKSDKEEEQEEEEEEPRAL